MPLQPFLRKSDDEMPRPFNEDMIAKWKITIPATLAGRIEYALTDPITKKPIYGARQKLIEALLDRWLAEQIGSVPENELPPIPTLEQLRLGDRAHG